MYLKKNINWVSLIIFAVFGVIVAIILFGGDRVPGYTISLVVYILISAAIVASFVLVGREIFHFFRGIFQIKRAGLVLSSKVWTWEEGKSISLDEIFPGMKEMMNIFDKAKLPTIVPSLVSEGESRGVKYKIFRVGFGLAQSPKIMQARLTFPKSFPGRLILQRVNGPTIGRDVDLESVEFNKKTLVYAKEPKVAFQILTPDFMDWYLKLSHQPVIVYDHQYCFYTIAEFKPQTEAEILSDINQLIYHLIS